MAIGNFSKVGRWALAVVAVAVLASVAVAAANVKIVGVKTMANAVVVNLNNNGNAAAVGSVSVTAVGVDGALMHSASSFSVAAGGAVSATLMFDRTVGSIIGVDLGITTESPVPF